MIVSEKFFCNSCRDWSPGPYRRGRCPRCTGVQVGGVRVCCGDCDRHPCECPRPTDADVPWLAGREGGEPIVEPIVLAAAS